MKVHLPIHNSSRTTPDDPEASEAICPCQPNISRCLVSGLLENQSCWNQAPRYPLTKVTVIHETNGRKYLEALTVLRNKNIIYSLTLVGASVIWKFAHSLIRERTKLVSALRQSAQNLLFRLQFWRLQRHTVILAVAPWDYRFLLYSLLRHRNRLIYNTSWPYWHASQVPRRFGFLTPLLRSRWLRVLASSKVEIVAVTRPAAESIRAALGDIKKVTVIPHLVSDDFFAYRARHAVPFKLLFVGELSRKKGVDLLLELIAAMQDLPVNLDIVGDGPLRTVARAIANRPGCRWHGHVRDRRLLAKITAECQLFIAPGLRTSRWEEFFGMSILESMACGVPCIASDHVGPHSFIDSGRNGVLVPERAVQETAGWVRKLLQDPAAWQAMSNEAFVTAGQYSTSKISSQWGQVLTDQDNDRASTVAGYL